MELLTEPLVHFVFFFVLKVPMDDLKSAVHHLKSFALDAAQEGWSLVRVARGKHHLTLDIFYMQFWGIERGITPLAKKKSIWGAKNLRFASLFFQNF